MLIKKIRIKNIRSYKEAEIEFPEGSTLLMGDIGSGKTSILLAIEFALFGLQPGQKANSLLRADETEAFVKLELEVDEKRVIIERTLEKSGKSVSQGETSISIDNSRFDGSVTEIKNKILSLLNYPQEFAKKTNDLYKFTVYTPQEEMKQIILESNDIRLNTLRHVFGIDKYKRIEENLDLITSRIRQEIRFKELEIGNIEKKKQSKDEKNLLLVEEQKRLNQVEIEVRDIELVKKQKQEELDELKKRIDERKRIENEKDKSEFAVLNKKDNLSSIERELRNIQEQLRTTGTLHFSEKDVQDIKSKIDLNEIKYKELNKEYITLITETQTNNSKIQQLKDLKNKISALDKCPTCLQLVNEDYKKNIVFRAEDELKTIESEILRKEKLKQETNLKLDETKKSIDYLRMSLSQLEAAKIRLEAVKDKEKRIIELEKQKTLIIADLEIMNKHISDLNNILESFKVYDEAYKKKDIEFREIVSKENNIMIKKAEISKEIQFLQKQILELEEEIKKIEELSKKLQHMRELEFWLNNKFIELVLSTEKSVMLKLREDFSKLFSEWFSILVSDSLNVRLDDAFSPVIQQQGSDIDYSYLSGGERTAVALAYRLALNQTINSLLSKIKTRDLVILDEPTDGFSESQLDKMRDVFQQLKVKQLILVSHEQKIESFVDNIIRFKKENGVTIVEK